MTTQNTYPKSMMHFHLLWLLLVLTAYIVISMTDLFPKWSIFHNVVLQTHFFVGLLVLVLVFPRLILRMRKYKEIPPITPELTKVNKIFVNIGHKALYVWMLLMPLFGWALASATYGSFDIYGIQIPGIVPQSRDNMILFRDLHEMFWGIGMVLISWHVAMALWHHFKMQDDTITRMFPWFKWRIKK